MPIALVPRSPEPEPEPTPDPQPDPQEPTVPSKSALIFGREPVVIAAALEALIAFVGAVLLHWSADQVSGVAAVSAAVLAVVVAVLTKDTLLAVGVGLIKAAVICLAGFGVNLPADQVALFVALFSSVLALWQRTQTSPVAAMTAPQPRPYITGP